MKILIYLRVALLKQLWRGELPCSDVLIWQHEPIKLRFHYLSPPPGTTSSSSSLYSTLNSLTEETSDVYPPGETESDVDVCTA